MGCQWKGHGDSRDWLVDAQRLSRLWEGHAREADGGGRGEGDEGQHVRGPRASCELWPDESVKELAEHGLLATLRRRAARILMVVVAVMLAHRARYIYDEDRV